MKNDKQKIEATKWKRLFRTGEYRVTEVNWNHFVLRVCGVRIDICPTMGVWKVEGEDRSKGADEFEKRVAEIRARQKEMKILDERFKELTK